MVVENTDFENKGGISSEEKFLAHFSRFIEHEKCHGKCCMGTQAMLTIIVQMIR